MKLHAMNKLLAAILLVTLLLSAAAFAQDIGPEAASGSNDKPVSGSSRQDLPLPYEYGISGKSRAGKDAQTGFPSPGKGYVTDIAKLMTNGEEEELERIIWQVEEQYGVEVAVVTINSIYDYPDTPNASIESFARGLFNYYGIGNLPKNDGMLLLVAVKDRKARIELGAYYGSEQHSAAMRVMENEITPYFKKGQYSSGIRHGVKRMLLDIRGIRVGWNLNLIVTIGLVLILICVIVSLFVNGKRGWGWVVVGLIIILPVGFIIILKKIAEYMPDPPSSSWSSSDERYLGRHWHRHRRSSRLIGRRSEDSDGWFGSGGWFSGGGSSSGGGFSSGDSSGGSGGFGGGFGGGSSGGGGATGSW